MNRLAVLATLLAVSCGGSPPPPPVAPPAPAPASAPAPVPVVVAPPAPVLPPDPPEPAGDPWAARTDLIASPPTAKPTEVALPKIQRFTLPNGLRVLIVENHDLPVVSFNLAVPGAGSEDEPKAKRSLAQYTAAMLTRGTKDHTADQIAATMDFVGGSLAASSTLEATHISCAAMSRDLDKCLTLLPDVVVNPAFPESEMKQISDQLVASIKQQHDNTTALAGVHFQNALWGDNNVRGWPETIEAVQSITRADLVAWHDRFRPESSILAIAGDVDAKALKAELTRSFAGWKKGKPLPITKYAEPKIKGITVRLVDKPDLTQSQIVVGHLGIAHGDPDFFATQLMNYTLGGGAFSSRLIAVVRSKGGKTYSASSLFERWKSRGEFYATTFTRSAETAATLALVLGEIKKMHDGGPTAEELAAAKSNLEGTYAVRFQTADEVADAVLGVELHGLTEAYVRQVPLKLDAVTLAQAKAAAQKHLDPSNLVIVIVGNADVVEPQLAAAGYTVERVGYLEPVSKAERLAKVDAKKAPADPRKTVEGKKLLDAALAAKGGADKLHALKDVVATGKVKLSMQGQNLEGEWIRTFVIPDKLRVDVTIPKFNATVTMTISDKSVWQKFGPQLATLPPDVAGEARIGLWRDRDLILLRHLDPTTSVQAGPKENVAGKDYDVVTVKRADGAGETKILLDPATHLIFRLVYEENGSAGVEEYTDYRAVDGVQYSFHQLAGIGQQAFDVTIEKVKVNAGVDATTFDPPPK